MNKCSSVIVCLALVVLGLGSGAAQAQGPAITSHEDGDTAYYNGHITLTCTGGVGTLTWSGPGSFSPSTGSQVVWTVPASGATAVVTVTDSCGNHDSVTFSLANRIYVDKDRSGDDGSTWLKAFKHLQDALAVAGAGNEIWVAEATYRPDEDKNHPSGTGNIGAHFSLLSGVAIYGGFAGVETDRDARNWVTHPTILSGDLDESNTHTSADSYHVVYALSVTNAVLDGFTITMGNGPQSDGNGMYNYGTAVAPCTPVIANCIFRDNYSSGDDADGAGMHNFHASPTVTNCQFIHNIAGDDGGALCNKNGANGTFTNCVFYLNETAGYEDSHGGAIFNTKGEYAGYVGSTPTFTNCVVANNLTRKTADKGGDGGGAADQDTGTSTTWTNCTFYGNAAEDDGGGLASRDGGASTVRNCIFWANTAGDKGPQVWQGGTPNGTATFVYCDIQGGFSGTGNIAYDPQFLFPTDPDGADDRFLTNDDGLQIPQWSPCFNAASASYAPAGDILGLSRGSQPDMGAYECDIADSDGDGMPNWFEIAYNLTGVDDDPDGDGWRNCTEYLLRTNPRDASSDGMDRMPSMTGPLEIEAKWGFDSDLYTTVYNTFPHNGSYAVGGKTYTIDRNWSAAERLYVDDYYDDSSDTFESNLQVFRHRRRYNNPANYPSGTPNSRRVQYKAHPTRYGAGWFRNEYGGDPEVSVTLVNLVLAGSTLVWTPDPQPGYYIEGVHGVFVDHPSYSLYDTLGVLVHVEDYRRKTDLLRNSTVQFTLSFDHVTAPQTEYELEIEIIVNNTDPAQLEEFFRIIFDFQHRWSGLTPSTTSKGGTYVPDYFD